MAQHTAFDRLTPVPIGLQRLLHQRSQCADAQQRRSNGLRADHLRPHGIGGQLALAAPVAHRFVEAIQKHLAKQGGRPAQDVHPGLLITLAATDGHQVVDGGAVDRREALAVERVFADEVAQFVADHRRNFAGIEKGQVRQRQIQHPPLGQQGAAGQLHRMLGHKKAFVQTHHQGIGQACAGLGRHAVDKGPQLGRLLAADGLAHHVDGLVLQRLARCLPDIDQHLAARVQQEQRQAAEDEHQLHVTLAVGTVAQDRHHLVDQQRDGCTKQQQHHDHHIGGQELAALLERGEQLLARLHRLGAHAPLVDHAQCRPQQRQHAERDGAARQHRLQVTGSDIQTLVLQVLDGHQVVVLHLPDRVLLALAVPHRCAAPRFFSLDRLELAHHLLVLGDLRAHIGDRRIRPRPLPDADGQHQQRNPEQHPPALGKRHPFLVGLRHSATSFCYRWTASAGPGPRHCICERQLFIKIMM